MRSRRLGGKAAAVAVWTASGGADRTANHRHRAVGVFFGATTATLARGTGKRHLRLACTAVPF